jgi:hypothetical protein
MIVLQFIQWQLIEIFTPFFMPIVWALAYGIFLISAILSLVTWLKKKDCKPFVIQAITVILLFLIPVNQIVLNLNFNNNKTDRNAVITGIEEGIITPNVTHNSTLIHLPDRYSHVSKGGGDVVIEKQGDHYLVLFFTYRGVLDNFSGFVYSPNDNEPQARSFGGDFKEIVKIDTNWYFVASS